MRDFVDIFGRVAEVERRLAGMARHGPVTHVDAAKGTVRIRLGGTDAEPFLSPWVPYAQTAGALRVHTPPSVGQQLTVMSPGGDFRQAVALPFTWSNQNASPSEAGDENVVTYGDVRMTLKADSLEVKIGGVTFRISGEGIDITGGHIKHDGRRIDATHEHSNVEPGGGVSGPPIP